MKMKQLLLLITIVFCHMQTEAQNRIFPFNEKDSIEIKGKICDYQPDQEEHFITFATYDLLGKATNHSIEISDQGEFRIKLYQPYDGDIQLSYLSAYLNFYVKAGVPLLLEIYGNKLREEANYNQAIIAKGTLATVNNLITKFASLLAQQNFPYTDFDKTQSDSLFAEKCINTLNKKRQILASFIQENRITDSLFIQWQSNHLQYDAGQEILVFPFLGKTNTEISQHKLLEFIKPILINNETAFQNSSYYSFLNRLANAQQIIININPTYSEIKQQGTNNTVDVALDLIDCYARGLTKEMLYYLRFSPRASNSNNRYSQVIKHPFLTKKLNLIAIDEDQSFKSYDVLERLQNMKVKSVLKERLITLFKNYQGTAIYIDFWGDWCGPCLLELPNYSKLITDLAATPIKFLFLSTFTKEANMLAIKEKDKINGDFVNLNNDEVAIVNNLFEFHSYPSHFLADAKGSVRRKFAQMSPDNVHVIARDILQTLEKAKN